MTTIKNKLNTLNVKLLLAIAAVISLTIFILRLYCSLDYAVLTSGCEEESLYAIWKYIHNFDIYLPNNRFPYTSSYFNINFYLLYGEICKLFINYLKLNETYLTIITRIISVIFTAGILITTYKLFRIKKSQQHSALIAIILILNPFLGFWSLTCRPDIAATFFSILALYQFQKSTYKINLSVILLLALSWSFKQSFIFTAIFIFLHAGIQKINISKAMLLGSLIAFILAVGYYLYGYNFFYSVFLSQKNLGLNIQLGIQNMSSFILKAGPIIFLFFVLNSFKTNTWLVATIFALTCILACKDGASDNYYFELYFIIIFIISTTKKENFELIHLYLIPQIFVLLALITGLKGNLIPTKFIQNELLLALQDNKEKSLVLDQTALNLPWIIHGPAENVYYVKSSTYDIDILNKPFEFGGIFGSLNKIKYTKIYIPKMNNSAVVKMPHNYIKTQEISGFYIFEFKPKNTTDCKIKIHDN
jgi:hypothetical protein